MFTTMKQYRSELDAAGRDLALFTAMRKDLDRVITRLERRLFAIGKAKISPFKRTMTTQIAIGIEKAATTRCAIEDQIAYMEHIVTAIERHRTVLADGAGAG